MSRRSHLEVHARFDLLCQNVRGRFVEGGEDFHGELGLDAALVDQFIEGVDEGDAETAHSSTLVTLSVPAAYTLIVPATAVELVVHLVVGVDDGELGKNIERKVTISWAASAKFGPTDQPVMEGDFASRSLGASTSELQLRFYNPRGSEILFLIEPGR